MQRPFSIQSWFDDRAPLRASFLARQGLADAVPAHVGEDGAYRRYYRLQDGAGTKILMETVPASTAIATPGHALQDFVRIGTFLRVAGLNTPEVFAVDETTGYALLEDFGHLSFRGAIEDGVGLEKIYALGTDILIHMRGLEAASMTLPNYYDGPVHLNRRRVIDWYLPAVTGVRNPDGLAEDYLAVWDAIERTLPPCPQKFLHIDYHLENLMWLPERLDMQACGILDYQAAMIGPLPYDLVNLLDDARRDVPAGLKQAMKDRYCVGMDAAARETFEAWYAILAAQFHCRIIGQFVRLAVRDGKTRYLRHLPRLAQYIRDALQQPLLAPLRSWFGAQGLDFIDIPEIHAATLLPLIRGDAV